MRVHIDFETRSEVDIWESGAWVYSAHHSTDVLCVAYAIDDGEVQLLTPKEFFTLGMFVGREDTIYVAHNAFFERAIWANVMVKKYGLPPIPLKRWRCTQAKACAYGLPKSLEKSALAIGLTHQKDKAGRAIMLRMCKPIPNKKGEIRYDNDPSHFRTLYRYCIQDVEVERALDKVLPDLSVQEQEVWFYDQLINTRGVKIDMPTVKVFIDVLKSRTLDLNQELTQITEGKVTKGTQVQSMLKYLNDGGAGLTSLNKQSVASAIEKGTLTNTQIRVLRLRQQLGKSSLAKYRKLVMAVDDASVLRDCFVYHSASTGRWGGKLVQLQNLPRGGTVDVDKAISDITTYGYPVAEMMYPGGLMDIMSTCIRGMIIPNEGKELYVVDYASIEARVVMWLAGETTGLEEFRHSDTGADEDIYVKMARRIYNDETLTKKENKTERQLGKQAILGCGYGMGGAKFGITCGGYGISITEQEATRIVNLYRATYCKVRNFWYDTERTAMLAYNHPDQIVGEQIKWVYRKDRDYLFCRLPSGRFLSYQAPRLQVNRFDSEGLTFMTEVNSQWIRKDTYGGHLVENITQAVARDLMAYSIPRLERAGFPTLMHTHDEIVSERPLGEGRISEMVGIMCELPEWATGCPIVAEGFNCMRYRK